VRVAVAVLFTCFVFVLKVFRNVAMIVSVPFVLIFVG